jgi:hypothetical protein
MTNSNEETKHEIGEEVLSWGRDGSKCANFKSGKCKFSVPIWTGKKYKVCSRKKDGKLYWKLVLKFGPSISGNKTSPTVIKYVLDRAKETGEKIVHVNHGSPVK